MAILSNQEKGLDANELRARRKKVLKVLGLRVSDYRGWFGKWKTFCFFAQESGKDNRLHFPQYVSLAAEAGLKRPDQIGRRREQYQLGRIGDTGPYRKGNARFITALQNQRERRDNGGTAIAVEKAGKKRGRAYRAVSPKGKVYIGQSLNALCKAKKLGQSSMSKLCRGDIPEYNGWTGEYTEDLKPWYRTKDKKCKTRKKGGM